eukprot:417321_1
MSHIKELIPPPTLTVVICKNHVETVDDPSLNNPKKSSLSSTYVGDVCPALATNNHEYIKVQNGYGFSPINSLIKDSKQWEWLPLYDKANKIKIPQTLLIKPPIKETIDCNYLTNLISNYKSLNQLLDNNTDKIRNKNNLTDDIISLIFCYLPFTFPIFISCTSLYRGRGDYTHWTYPYTKSKGWILKYLQTCENTFNNNEHCYYISEWYLMKDDAPVDFKNKSDWIDEHDIVIKYKTDNNYERKWNEPILITQKQTNKLSEAITDRNNVGGSYWLRMTWNKEDKNTDFFIDNINQIDGKYKNVKSVHSRIGGSCGIKSRCYYQTMGALAGRYLPMSVLNVCCDWNMFNSIMQSNQSHKS